MTGSVKFLKADRGFGFITGEDGHDRFFHAKDCVGVRLLQLNAGDQVVFEPVEIPVELVEVSGVQTRRGGRRAAKVARA